MKYQHWAVFYVLSLSPLCLWGQLLLEIFLSGLSRSENLLLEGKNVATTVLHVHTHYPEQKYLLPLKHSSLLMTTPGGSLLMLTTWMYGKYYEKTKHLCTISNYWSEVRVEIHSNCISCLYVGKVLSCWGMNIRHTAVHLFSIPTGWNSSYSSSEPRGGDTEAVCIKVDVCSVPWFTPGLWCVFFMWG